MNKVKLTLRFPPDLTGEPVTYKLIKEYNLIFNILNAEISPGKRGKLTIELIGEQEDIERGIEYLVSCGISCKLFNKAIIWNEDKCVHCGACTAVCVANALSLSPETGELTFDKEKCLVCELCCKACPLGAIDVNVFNE